MRTSEIKSTLQAMDGLAMPNRAEILRRVTAAHARGITALDPPSYPLPTPRPPLLRRPASAAALALALLGIGIGSAVGVEQYTYRTALDFFADYNLSTEGLSRGELWEVYRDITTGSFSLSDTAWVLQSNMGLPISGSLSAKEAESLWEGWKEDPASPIPEGITVSPRDMNRRITFTHTQFPEQATKTVRYSMRVPCFEPNMEAEKAALAASASNPMLPSVQKDDTGFYYDIRYDVHTAQSYLCKRKDSTVIWSHPVEDLQMDRVHIAGEYIAVTGSTEGAQHKDILVYLFTQDGELCWQTIIDHGSSENVQQFLYENHTIKLISKADSCNICYTVLDMKGNILQSVVNKQNAVTTPNIGSVVPFKNGYILIPYRSNSLFVMDQNGIITDYCDYSDANAYGEDGDEDFVIIDVLPTLDRIYIRIEVTDKSESGRPIDPALALIREKISDTDAFPCISDPPYNDIIMAVREAYRSLLLVCDANTLEPITAYQMNEAYPSYVDLSQNRDGSIAWTSSAPYVTAYSPYTSAYTLLGTSYDYVYTIRPDGSVEDEVHVYIGIHYWG